MADWFAQRVLSWAENHGRVGLPWQQDRTPYRVWVSEIMLQQTQVQTTIPYFERFVERFPTVQSLASAPLDDVLRLWAGLGYYRRARLLHEAALIVLNEHDGELPDTLYELEALPGIGRSTAGAIRASGFNQRGVVLDGNVKRVLARFHAVDGEPGRAATTKELWRLAESHTPCTHCADYAQAIVDLGATCCVKTNPSCNVCPLRSKCLAYHHDRVAELPNPARRTKPRQETLNLLLIVDLDDRVLLKRQRDDGLFGGMWLPMQFTPNETPHAAIAETGLVSQKPAEIKTLPSFTHTLSHIQFAVQVHVARLRSTYQLPRAGEDLTWFNPRQAPPFGFARITSKALEHAGILQPRTTTHRVNNA